MICLGIQAFAGIYYIWTYRCKMATLVQSNELFLNCLYPAQGQYLFIYSFLKSFVHYLLSIFNMLSESRIYTIFLGLGVPFHRNYLGLNANSTAFG